jgi:hypothetical protein
LLCVAVQIGEGVELVHQSLRVDPAQLMPADDELAGIIADHDGLAGETMGMNAAPQCALGGNLHRVWRDVQGADAEPRKMRLPCNLVGEICLRLRRQLVITGPARARPRM